MIIYRDLISNSIFSDIYHIQEIADGLCLEVQGKKVSRTEYNIDDFLIGGNTSAEVPDGDAAESTVVTCRRPSLAGDQLHQRSLQEIHQILHAISQRQTGRAETRKIKAFNDGLPNKSSASLHISKTTSSLLLRT
ncbi:translationally-controlled tumor protein-like [Tenrec ecaudatus]|uniref:translationally-controlled tumor protein-like n=1 Tax=Tenrec ecaudatus TaxID=94439 RepID=UPI003F599532